jgi:hypothetical protein
MPELERMLRAVGGELEYPPTPDLATAVASRLAPEPARRPRLLPAAGLRRALALALVALLVLASAVVAAVPSARDALLELFGLPGATVERRARLPDSPGLRPLELGRRVALDEAADSLGFTPLTPAALGPPGAAYVRRSVPGGELSLAYRPGPGLPEATTTRLGLLIGEFRGDLAPEYAGKVAGEATRVERLEVEGRRALWIEGAPHFFFYRPPDRAFAQHELRLAANVLLLERGPLLVRMEGAFDRGRALALARSLR